MKRLFTLLVLLRKLICVLTLGFAFSCAAVAGQMTAGDLLKMCTSSNEGDKTACTFYILGVTEGADLAANVVKDSSGVFRELKDEPICVPKNLSSKALELVVRMSMGEDLAVFPQDRDEPAVSFVSTVIRTKFPCRKPNTP
jgi:hypothetical protein